MEKRNRGQRTVETENKQQNSRTEFNIAIITSNVNEPNTPIKRLGLSSWIKIGRSNYVVSKRDPL